MASAIGIGLLSGLGKGAKEFVDERLKEAAEQRKPSVQLQKQFVDSLRSILNQPTQPQLQEQADVLEQRAALGQLGPQVDLQAQLGETPRGLAFDRANQGRQFVDQLRNLGIAGLSGEGITFKQPSTDLATLIALMGGGGGTVGGFIPERIRQGPVTFVNPEATESRTKAAVRGKGLGVVESSQLENFQTAVDSIGRIEKNLAGPQGGVPNLIQAGLPFAPGARGLAFELKNVSDTLLRMRSGAQINEKEFTRLRSLLPVASDVLFGEPGVVERKLNTFKQNFQSVLERQRRRGFSPIGQEGIAESQAGGEFDPSSLSDEELRAIAGQ